MKCEFEHTVVQGSNGYASSSTFVAICKTHHWQFGQGTSTTTSATYTSPLCPIGQIEDATEKAIAEIKAAKADSK